MNRRQRRGILKAKNRNLGSQPRYTDEVYHFPLQKKRLLTSTLKRAKNRVRRKRESAEKRNRRNRSKYLRSLNQELQCQPPPESFSSSDT